MSNLRRNICPRNSDTLPLKLPSFNLPFFLEETKERERVFDSGLDGDKDGLADRYTHTSNRIIVSANHIIVSSNRIIVASNRIIVSSIRINVSSNHQTASLCHRTA